MNSANALIFAACLGSVIFTNPHAACAQIVPPAPPAKAPEPEYVPPPGPPPIAPVVPDASAPAAPSLVEQGPDGKLKVYDISLDEAAVRAYPLDAQRRLKADQTMMKREREIERFVVENLPKVRIAAEAAAKLDAIASFDELFKIKNAATPLAQERLLDRLQRDGAVSPMQRIRMDETIRAYEAARMNEWKALTGADPIKIAQTVGRQGFADSTRDAFKALDRLLVRLAKDDAALSKLSAPPNETAISQLKSAALSGSADRPVAFLHWTDDQLGAALRSLINDEPAPR
jgi:hypothetical protein